MLNEVAGNAQGVVALEDEASQPGFISLDERQYQNMIKGTELHAWAAVVKSHCRRHAGRGS